jgi:hypothetical protein
MRRSVFVGTGCIQTAANWKRFACSWLHSAAGRVSYEGIGDLDQGEWTSRQLRFLTRQLDLVAEVAGRDGRADHWLWSGAATAVRAVPR